MQSVPLTSFALSDLIKPLPTTQGIRRVWLVKMIGPWTNRASRSQSRSVCVWLPCESGPTESEKGEGTNQKKGTALVRILYVPHRATSNEQAT